MCAYVRACVCVCVRACVRVCVLRWGETLVESATPSGCINFSVHIALLFVCCSMLHKAGHIVRYEDASHHSAL